VQTADLTRWHGDRGDPNWRNFIQAVKSAVGHHHEETPAASSGTQTSAGDVTIENTFWTSIKDGKERSDFEAYLKRYPTGHFADLARNRLASLDRAQQQARKPAPAPQRPAQPAASPPGQQQRAQQQRPTSQQRPAAPQAQAAPKKKSNAGVFALAGLGVVIVAAGGFFGLQMMNSGGSNEPAALVEAQQEPLATAAVESDLSTDNESDLLSAAPADAPQDESALTEDAALAEVAADGESGDTVMASEGEEAVEAEDVAAAEDEAVQSEPGPGDVFTDCDACPQMTILPGGTFLMGSPDDEAGRFPYEGPQHEVTVSSFAIGTYEVTFDQWAACVEDGGCNGYNPGDAGFGRGARPALFISWRDAQNYVNWLSRKAGRSYRLPSEAEWEYAARGGEASPYWWGERFDRSKAALGGTVEVGAFAANGFGLHEILGNAGEWVQDCYLNNFTETPTDGSAATSGDCSRRVIRGGSWRGEPRELRSANRARITATIRDRSMGFRVAADLE
jgi:formylglycine-generating enzyme required for sulfatase activity